MKTRIDLGFLPPANSVSPYPFDDRPKKEYPLLNLNCGDALLESLPESGEITLRFRVARRKTLEQNGERSCDLSLEIREILSVEDYEIREKEKPESAEAALDRLAKLDSAEEDD